MATPITLTGAVLQAFMERGISVSLQQRGKCLGSLMPQRAAKGGLRLAQYRACADADWALRQARIIVATKIANQSFMLRRRSKAPDSDFFREMKKLQKSTLQAVSAAALMGIEGQASALYFPRWAATLPPAYPFLGRTRRPPRDVVNACLSYLSALCQGDMLRAIAQVGLDPDLGVLHSVQDYRHNLVLDLMEPFRPILVEGVARDVLNHGLLGPESTQMCAEDGGCYLTSCGRVALIKRYQQRLFSSFMHLGHSTTLQQCMLEVALTWKQAVEDPLLLASNFKLS